MMKIDNEKNEFYVGYLHAAPNGVASVMQKIIIVGGVVMIILCATLVLYQKRFSLNTFDFEKPTTIEGYLSGFPVPHLRLPVGKDSAGSEHYQKIMLVGYGKKGAQQWMLELEKIYGKIPVGKVSVRGNLIYGEGKAWMQVENLQGLRVIDKTPASSDPTTVSKRVKIVGEIVDPKCYFGVMKPGEGKVHKSCAARCIAGGIPPVLHSTEGEFYLLTMDTQGNIYQDVAPLIGQKISLSAQQHQVDDWKILKVDQKDLSEATAQMRIRRKLTEFQKDITLCSR
jgi:hypothetical protein